MYLSIKLAVAVIAIGCVSVAQALPETIIEAWTDASQTLPVSDSVWIRDDDLFVRLSAVPGPSGSPIQSFSWSLTDAEGLVLDGVEVGATASFAIGPLPDGTSTLQAKAFSAAGAGPLQAFTFRVDTVPDSIVSLGIFDSPGGIPIPEGVAQPNTRLFASWTPAVSTAPIVGYSWSITGAPDVVVDTADPFVEFGPLAEGHTVFRVRAIDEAGNFGTSESFVIIVESAVTPESVTIDIKPGSDPNCFNINGHGVIPVAILGSDSFDVTNIDQASLLFGGLEVRIRGKKGPLCGLEYSNGDTYLDLVCHFEDDAANWSVGDEDASLTGTLFDGSEFEGSDFICIVP